MVETSGSVLHLNHPYNATRVYAGKIDVRVAELQKESGGPISFPGEKGGFWEEFESLQQQVSHLISLSTLKTAIKYSNKSNRGKETKK